MLSLRARVKFKVTVLTLSPTRPSSQIYIKTAYDVSIANPYSAAMVNPYLGLNAHPGHAAKRRARTKVAKYSGPCQAIGYEFSPLCFEHTLGWDSAVTAVVRRVMEDVHRLNGDNLRKSLRFWTIRLSFALARAIALKVSSSIRFLSIGNEEAAAHPLSQQMLFPPLVF